MKEALLEEKRLAIEDRNIDENGRAKIKIAKWCRKKTKNPDSIRAPRIGAAHRQQWKLKSLFKSSGKA